MDFYLGTHEPGWLGKAGVRLMVSRRRLARQGRWPRAIAPWALDSGGFSELSMYGEWRTSAKEYAREVVGWRESIGLMEWAAVQDWMCEPAMLAKTGKGLRAHQGATIRSYDVLRDLAPEVRWLPVLQGYKRDDYMRHLDAYGARGDDLTDGRRVGLGSVCRRQGTREAAGIVRELAGVGVRLHLFGFKRAGLPAVRGLVASSDSMAWCKRASKVPPLDGCTHAHCSNCLRFALEWRAGTLG
jgi:hypothetical protein